MKYLIQTKIYNRFNANSGEFTIDHEPLPVKPETSLFKRSRLTIDLPAAAVGSELKAEIVKAFPDLALTGLKLSAKGAELADTDQVDASQLTFEATFGIDAIAEPVSDEPVASTRSQLLSANRVLAKASAQSVNTESAPASPATSRIGELKARWEEYLTKHTK